MTATDRVPGGRFSDIALGYARTMVPSLRPVASRVVAAATLQPGERVLDIGTGTGIAAAGAAGERRMVIGVDAAPGMLELARREAPGVEFLEMDFHRLAFEDASFDCVLAAHSLLFSDDRVAALREWRRVTRAGGRISLSVPGPDTVVPAAIYGDIYDRHGIHVSGRYPTEAQLARLAEDAGWRRVRTEADPGHAIVLQDEEAFRVWREIGSRGAATQDWPPERHAALTDEMLAVTPRDRDGSLRIPFGVLYLQAIA